MTSEISSRTGKSRRQRRLSAPQRDWLSRGLDQPGGKLPLFDGRGQRVRKPVVDACIAAGWAERWFDNPLKPDWLVCRLTDAGRAALTGMAGDPGDDGAAGGDVDGGIDDDGEIASDGQAYCAATRP